MAMTENARSVRIELQTSSKLNPLNAVAMRRSIPRFIGKISLSTPTSMKKPDKMIVANITKRNIWFACSLVPATAEIRMPVVDPVKEVRLMMIIKDSKPVFRFKSKANTQSEIRRRDWKNPIMT